MNYEETTSQIITVEASDGMNRSSKIVHIDILPVNEFAPVFKLKSSVWQVTENTPRNICVPVGLFCYIQLLSDLNHCATWEKVIMSYANSKDPDRRAHPCSLI